MADNTDPKSTAKALENIANTPLKRRFVVAAGASAVLWPGASQALGIASTLRLHDHASHTRLVLELSEQIDFGLFRLADPYRIVIDLPELDWAVGNGGPGAVGLVKAVRFGQFQAGNARIVVDLAGPANIKHAFVLPATGGTPCRFVVDLEPMAREPFMALVGPQHRVGQFGAGTQTAAAQPAPAKAAPKAETKPAKEVRKKLVAIDPGHGGVDPRRDRSQRHL